MSRFNSLFTKESFKGIKHRKPGQDAAEGCRGEDDDGAFDKVWQQPFDDVKVFNEELRGIVPVPYMPPVDEARFAEVERIAYILRRAHLEHGVLGAGVAALAAAGLLLGGPLPAARSTGGASGGAGFGERGAEEAATTAAARRKQRAGERLRFQDPWMWLEGPEEVAEYSRRLEAAGGELKLVHLTLRCASYE